MSREHTRLVAIGAGTWTTVFAERAQAAERAAARLAKALPGDRQEAVRYSQICSELDVLAWDHEVALELDADETAQLDAALDAPRHPWWQSPDGLPFPLRSLAGRIKAGAVIYELRLPYQAGEPQLPTVQGRAQPPARIWRSATNQRGLYAVQERWREQLQAAVAGAGEPIVPSQVSNRVLSEGLREFAARGDEPAVRARVVYRDGSEADPFPLRGLDLRSEVPSEWPVFRVQMISQRHPEMDSETDAAWIRNRVVSQVRQAAQTDRIAYELSMRQFKRLAAAAPIAIHLHQTGLEPVLIGIYRAFCELALNGAHGLALVPRYHREDGYEEGTPWVI